MRLFQRNGIWHVEIERNQRRSLKTSDEREAHRLFKEIKRAHLQDRLVKLDTNRVSLADFTADYLASREGMAHNTLASDRRALRYLADVVGPGTPLALINTRRLDEFKSACLARGVQPRSVNSYLRHIKGALSTAREWGLIQNSPTIKMFPVNRAIPRVLTEEEISRLLDESRKSNLTLYRLLTVYLWTGCRRKEGLNLTWPDCHLTTDPLSAHF